MQRGHGQNWLLIGWTRRVGTASMVLLIQTLPVHRLVMWDIDWSKIWIGLQCTSRNFTHRALAICDLANHAVFRIITDQGSQMGIILSWESITIIPFYVRTSYVKIREWDRTVPSVDCHTLLALFEPFWRYWISPTTIQAGFWGVQQICFHIITNCEI